MASRLAEAPPADIAVSESSDDDDDTCLNTECVTMMPQKKYYRQRAHVNPLSIQNLLPPVSPSCVQWNEFFPQIGKGCVEFLDVGCGYGGLLISLATLFPDKYILGGSYSIYMINFIEPC